MASNVDVALLVAGPRQRLQPAPDRALPRGRLVERRDPGRRPQQVGPRRRRRRAAGRGRRDRARASRRSRSRPGPAPGSTSCAATCARARPRRSSGSSGVGKSTLVNALLGEDRQATAEVRESDSRGRHTTTHRELFELPGGALLVDTPGIRALEVLGADEGVEAAFDDVVDIAATCRFSDCRHEGEPGCAVRAALADGRLTEERLASHRKLEREIARAAREGDPRARAEHRRTWKIIHKSVERAHEHASTEPSDDTASEPPTLDSMTEHVPCRTRGRARDPGSPGAVLPRRRRLRAAGRADRRGHAGRRRPVPADRANLQIDMEANDGSDPVRRRRPRRGRRPARRRGRRSSGWSATTCRCTRSEGDGPPRRTGGAASGPWLFDWSLDAVAGARVARGPGCPRSSSTAFAEDGEVGHARAPRRRPASSRSATSS